MYIVIESSANSFLQTEYHIINQKQMEQFIIDKDCDDIVSIEEFSSNSFGESLESALNESDEEKQYQVVHIWLH